MERSSPLRFCFYKDTFNKQPQKQWDNKAWKFPQDVCVCAQAFSHLPNPLEGQLDAKSHHSFNTSTATDTRLAWSSFAWFSPKQWIPQSLRTCVGTLHCDSSIWTQHTVQLMIIQSWVLSQGPSEHRACLPWYWSDCTSFIQVHF